MKRAFMVWVALAVLCASAGMSFAQGPPVAGAAKKTIVGLEERWLANENNPTILNVILADDFVHVLPQGMISKKEHIDFVRAHPFGPFAEHKFEKLDVRVYGNVAVATGIVVAIPAGKQTGERTLFTDVFAFRNGRWQVVNAQESPAAGHVK